MLLLSNVIVIKRYYYYFFDNVKCDHIKWVQLYSASLHYMQDIYKELQLFWFLFNFPKLDYVNELNSKTRHENDLTNDCKTFFWKTIMEFDQCDNIDQMITISI